MPPSPPQASPPLNRPPGEPRNLVQLLANVASNYGTLPFASNDDGTGDLTFRELDRQADAVAHLLRNDLGLQPGSRAALLIPNCTAFLPAYFGVLRAGIIAVPVNIRLKPAEMRFILQDCGAAAIFTHPRTLPAAVEANGAHVPLVLTGLPKGERPPEGVLLLPDTSAQPVTPADPDPDDVASIIYTSGTTGVPKGAMLTHGNILFNVQSTIHSHGLQPDDTHLLVVPLFHVTGLNTILPTALSQGARLVISSQVDPAALLRIAESARCTTFFGVPTTFYLMTAGTQGDSVPESLRLICYSGAPMSAVTIQRLREMFPGVELHNFFGLTETTSVSTVLPDNQALERPDSVGVPPPGVEIAVVNEDGQPLPAGEVGELVIRGPSVFKGYFNRPETTEDAFLDGWLRTGDLARMDAEGYLFLQGRKKEMIIVAGENVYPLEVENALCAHPAVQEAAVFSRPDRFLGEVVHAAVVLRPESDAAAATERDLKRWLNDRLASYKLPRTIRFLPALPRNPSGKVVKRELAQVEGS